MPEKIIIFFFFLEKAVVELFSVLTKGSGAQPSNYTTLTRYHPPPSTSVGCIASAPQQAVCYFTYFNKC